MGIEEKFQAVRAIIDEHNSVIGDAHKSGWIEVDGLVSKIKAIGGTSEARLKRFSYEDILSCFEEDLKPVALAKEIAAIFRDHESESKPTRYTSKVRASHMSPRELVEAFDPEEQNAVYNRLKSMSRGEKFIIYSDGRIVDIDNTVKLLLEVKQGFPGRDNLEVDGSIKQAYKITELPDVHASENPIYHGRPLRPDGTCDQTGRSWDGIPLEVRQLVRLAIDEGELKVNIDMAHNIIDMAVSSDAASTLRTRYRKTAVKYLKLKQTNGLPSLLIPIGSNESGSIRNGQKVNFRN